MKLFELTENYYNALEVFTDPNQEISGDVVHDTMDAIEGEIEDKCINVGKVIKSIDATVNAIDEQVKCMTKRKKVMENNAKSLRDYLKRNMAECGISKVECEWFKISIRKNPASLFVDVGADVPDKYFNVEIKLDKDSYNKILRLVDDRLLYSSIIDSSIMSLNKSLLKTDVKSGAEIPGATLVQATRVDLR